VRTDPLDDYSPNRLPAWCAAAVEGLLLFTLVAAAALYGGADAWAQHLFFCGVFGAAAFLVVGLWAAPHTRLRWTWAFVPMTLFLAVAVLQLVPLRGEWVERLSPAAASVRSDIAAVAGRPVPATQTLSLYPLATERQLRLLLAGATLFFVTVQFYRNDRPRLTRLLRGIVLTGLAFSCLALWQNLTQARTIYGLVQSGHLYSGPFANHSHFGQFVNLTLGAAAALLAVRLREMRQQGYTLSGIRGELRRLSNWDLNAAAGLLVLGPTAVALSMTRGGTLSLLIAAAVSVFLYRLATPRNASRATYSGLAIGLAVLLVLLAVGFNAVFDRLATLRDLQDSSGGRFEIVRDVLATWRSFPLFGTGLGTHAFVFPMFDRSDVQGWATHAENEYVQLLGETGAIGWTLGIAFLVLVLWRLWGGIARSRGGRGIASGAPAAVLPGLAMGLIAVMLHSWTDFGQHLPGVFCLSAITCGLIVNAAARPQEEQGDATSLYRSLALGVATVALVVAGGWTLRGSELDRVAESHWDRAVAARDLLDVNGWSVQAEDYRNLLAEASAASEIRPEDVEYAYWLNVWRWEAVTRQSVGGALDEQLVGWSRQIADAALATVDHCPTFGRPLAFAGQIRTLLGTSAAGEEMIKKGASLASYDPQAQYFAGLTAAKNRDAVAAAPLLRRSVKLGASPSMVIDTFVTVLDDPQAGLEIARNDPDRLRHLIGLLEKQPRYAAFVETRRKELDELIVRRAAAPTADPGTLESLASQYLKSGQVAMAIDALRQALAVDYGNVERRLHLARVLSEAGRRDEALAEAKICLRLRPGDSAAERLVGDLATSKRGANMIVVE
jgi:O-antigen ligase/tetratricopeptide (TPR) repeat protein